MKGDFDVQPDRWVSYGKDLQVQGDSSRGAARVVAGVNVDPEAWGNDIAAEAVASWAGQNAERWALVGNVSENTGTSAVSAAGAFVEADEIAARGVTSSVTRSHGEES